MRYFTRSFQVLVVFAVMILAQFSIPPQDVFASDTTPPVIDVWYGDRQVFGSAGLPQKWINILGSVRDPESSLRSITFSLNGGPAVSLRTGPDTRRLEKPGDFNIELDPNSLAEGNNPLVISATNQAGLPAAMTVTIEFHRRAWPIPYQIDWSKVKQAQDVLQIVDVKWQWDASGIRPVELGYDRVLAIGDPGWSSYEVTAAFTLHGGFGKGSRTGKPGGCKVTLKQKAGFRPGLLFLIGQRDSTDPSLLTIKKNVLRKFMQK